MRIPYIEHGPTVTAWCGCEGDGIDQHNFFLR